MEPRVHFYLDRAISEKKLKLLPLAERRAVEKTPRQIWAFLTFLKNTRVKVYLGERIPQECWDATRERVNANKFKGGAHDFNKWLSDIENSLLIRVRSKYRFNQTESPTKEGLQALVKGVIAESKEVQTNSSDQRILISISKYLDSKKSEWTTGFNEIMAATAEHLKNFETWRKSPLTTMSDYNEVWREFKNYLVSLDLNNSTSNKYLKIFRRLLKFLVISGTVKPFNVDDLPPFKEIESFRIALKENEIEALSNVVLHEQRLKRTRDLMILQVFTGQRIGDLPQVLEQVNRGAAIHVTQGKTGKRVTVPRYPLLERHLTKIAKRYPDGLDAFSEQKFNEYMKECCEKAKIKKNHTWIEFKGDKQVTISKPRNELVSSHTLRRTFATISKKKGISDKAIMAITGHSSHKVFLEYIRIDDEDVNQEFNDKMK